MKQQFISFLTRHTSTRFLLQRQRRLRDIPRLVINIKKDIASSHVPPQERKSALRILLERIYLNWRYGYLGYIFYFSLKLERKGERLSVHITEGEFVKTRDYVNFNYPSRPYAYAGITRDKVLSKQLLSALGAKVPQQRCKVHLANNGELAFKREDGRPYPLDSLVGCPMFFKPVEAENGEGVLKFFIEDHAYVNIGGKRLAIADFLAQIKDIVSRYGVCMIEDFIVQHDELSRMYPLSVNTIRAYTVQKEGGAEYFGAIVRIGAHGAHNDNYASGGVIVGVDERGVLSKKGYTRPEYGEAEITAHPDSGLAFEGFKVPYFEEAIALCVSLHNQMQGLYSIGWDIAITPDGPMIVEFNDNWEIQPLEIVTERGWRKEYNETFVRTAKLLKKSAAAY